MTILDLLPDLKRVASTGGGEYCGPCPFCGGNDRFRAWPDSGKTGRFWCRGCGKKGDGIQLLRDRDGLGYRDACFKLGVMPASRTFLPGPPTRLRPTTWTPRQGTAPGDAWTNRAGVYLQTYQRNLAGPSGANCRKWLKGRGLHPETIERVGLGWNPGTRNESCESWGLPSKLNEKTGKPKTVWLPRGLVIPLIKGGQVHRLRVRQPNPGDDPPYVIVSGSASTPLTLGTGTAAIIVESELCAILLAQEVGDLCGVIALGSNTTRPDQATDQALKAAGVVLVALDSDGPGAREAWQWWLKHYPHAKRWPCPVGKDPTEAKQAGHDLRAWIMAGLPGESSSPKSAKEITAPAQEPAQRPPAPHQRTLQATQTGKAYQSKGELISSSESASSAATSDQEATSPPGTYKDQGSERRTVFEPFPAAWNARFNEEQLERLAIMTVCGGLTDLEAFAEVISQC